MLEFLKKYFTKTSLPIILAMISLMCIGISAIAVSQRADTSVRGFATKQGVFAVIGLMVFVMVTLLPYKRIGRAAYPMFVVTLFLLVLVLQLPAIRNSRRWINLKIIKIQPSEIAKLTYIILLAWYLRYGDHFRKLTGLVIPFLFTVVPLVLILREPDLGTSLLLLPTLYFMLFVAGAKLRHLLGIIAVGAIFMLMPLPLKASASWSSTQREDRRYLAYGEIEHGDSTYFITAAPLALMKNHQLDRIVGFLKQDDNDPRITMGKGYQLHQSKIVLGSGMLIGRAGWQDVDVFFRMLPDDHTDFIFAVIAGQWGFAGCLVVLFMYGVILIFGIRIAMMTHDAFGRLLVIGVLALLFSQLFINVGMTMGLMPITGMTLPFISYGGSSLVINCAAIGILINVYLHRAILLSPKPFEYGKKREKNIAIESDSLAKNDAGRSK